MASSLTPYTEGWLALPIPYVGRVAEELRLGAAGVDEWWNDPCDPRDATIKLAGGDAAVWDEESGWRIGRFVSGRQGVRTRLHGAVYIGGGVLPSPAAAATALLLKTGNHIRPQYRTYLDHSDGLDGRLATYESPVYA